MIRLENVLKISLQGVLKTFWRHLQSVLKTSWRCLEDVFARRLEDVLKTSWRRIGKTSWRRLENVLKMSWKRIAKTNILVLTKTSSEDIRLRWTYLSWSRRLQDVFKTSSSRRMFAGGHISHSSLWKYFTPFSSVLLLT